MEKNEQDKSQAMFDAIITGMKEWRASHPKATMREIEMEARERVSRLEAHLIEESAEAGSGQRVGRQAARGATQVCELRGTISSPRQAEEKDASHDGKRGGVGKNLRNLSELPDRFFPPSMRNEGYCREA